MRAAEVLTITRVKNAARKNYRYEIRDKAVPGFQVRVYPTGVKTYFMEYKKGKRKRIGDWKDFESIDEAKDAAREIKREYLKTGDVAETKPQKKKSSNGKITFGDFLENDYLDFLEDRVSERRLESAKGNVIRARMQFQDWLEKPVDEIDLEFVTAWRKKRKNQKLQSGKKLSPHTVNRDLNTLKAVLTVAARAGFIPHNPIQYMDTKDSESSKRKRYLKPEEQKRLHKALEETKGRIKPITILALNTGMRRGEIFNLTWKDIDIENRRVFLRSETTKSDKERIIRLNPDALKALQDWNEYQIKYHKRQNKRMLDHHYVFPGPALQGRIQDVGKSWDAFVSKSET